MICIASGFFADFAALTSGVTIAVIFYGLFRPLSRSLALLSLALSLVSNVVSLATLTQLFAPPFADFLFPYVLLPSLIAETSLAVWLTLFGVNDEKWRAIALKQQ